MSDRTAAPASRSQRSREHAAEPPARRSAREPDHAEGARGTHDVATIPVAGPRAVTLWRRRPAIAAGAARRRPVVQAKRRMSRPRDPCEREADAVAARVVARRAPAPPATRRGADHRRLLRARSPSRGPPATDVPTTVESVVDRPAQGQPLNLAVRRRIEPHVGADLGHVRVRHEPEAARAIGARAFTSGSTIFLGPGESATDVALIAHEATHVVQQSAMPAAGAPVMRQLEFLEDAAEWVLDGVRSRVRALPGYTLLSQIAGVDLLSGRPVSVTRTELIQELLSWGPFAPAVGPVLQTVGVIEELFTFISQGLSAHNLTLDRLRGDLDAAWDRISVSEGIEGNLAIVRGYVDALLADVRAFVGSIVDRVLQMIRAAVVAIAEPLLQAPPIAPVWNLAKKVLHYDPLLGRPVDASTAEILADFLRLIGQEQRLAQMQERGTLQETADWLDTQLETFRSLVDELGTLFSDAWAAIQPENLPGLLDTLPALANRAFGVIGRVADFATTVIGKVLELIKNALLGWLSEHAYAIPGFRLLTVIIGRNPFTGEAVERTAASLIGGFIALLPNGEATYQQLAESGVIAEAGAQIESAMSRLNISLELIVGTFRGIWDSLTLDDLLAPIAAFDRIVAAIGEPLGRIFEFIGVVVETVVSLVLRLMNFPSDLLASIIANVAQAITDIQRDPVRFLLNMLEALKQGFTGFFNNILTYLLQGLTAWLFRGLGQLGITIPPDLSLQSILTLVLQVLGLSVDYLWTKLGEHIGPERVAQIRGALDRLGEAWAFIQDIQERGFVAVWEYIASQLGNLWDTLLGMAQEWIMTTIVNNVVARLLSMLDPTGVMAVVNSFIAFFNAVQSAIEYLRDILEIVNRYVTTLAQIAAGNITPGAQMLEQGLAAAIPIAIGFLANQVGIGNVPEKIVELIGRLRQLIDQAVDWLIQQALRLGQAALNALGLGGTAPGDEGPIHEPFEVAGEEHEIFVAGAGALMVASNGGQPVQAIDRLRALHTQYTALPATATRTERLAVIRQMIALIRADPSLLAQLAGAGLGDPPNLGAVAPHRSQTQRFQPRSGGAQYARLWELESEHVIPRSYVSGLFEAYRSPSALAGSQAVTESEYREMHTILIYKGAADVKTEAPGGDNRVYRELAESTRDVMTAGASTPADAAAFDLARRTAMSLFISYAANAADRTVEAIDREHGAKPDGQAQTNGAIRARPAAPPRSEVERAYLSQVADVRRFLSARLV
jgi:phage-related protein